MTQTMTVAVGYFGKVPSRGDFVRTADNQQLMALLDRWAGSTIEQLSRNPDWKRLYDQAPPLHFAFLGSRSRLVVGGHLLPSHDASQRRFPLLSAIRTEVANPLGFIGRSPMALNRVWSGLSRLSREAAAAEDAGEALKALGEARHELSVDPAAYAAPFDDFMETQTIGSLQRLLHASGHSRLLLRHALPALGLLLRPVLTGAGNRVLAAAYQVAQSPLKTIARQSTATDFRTKSISEFRDIFMKKKKQKWYVCRNRKKENLHDKILE